MEDPYNPLNLLPGAEKVLDLATLGGGPGKLIDFNDSLKVGSHLKDLATADSAGAAWKSVGDLAADATKVITPALKSAVQRQVRNGTVSAAAAALPMIETALKALTVMGITLGFGDPEPGDRFGKGAQKCGEIANLQDQAIDKTWQGSGSDGYHSRNAEQRKRTAALARADTAMQEIIHREAEQLKTTTTALDEASDILTAAIPVALAYMLIPEGGVVMSEIVQFTAVLAASAISLPAYNTMISQSGDNAQQVSHQINAYSKIAAEATGTQSAQ